MGGVGKTALALVLANRLTDRYPDAQLFLNLRGADPEHRPTVTPVEAMQNIIRCFQPEARLPDTLDALAHFYNSVLQDGHRRILLLLDNADNADQVKPLLPPPNCLLLVTSRRQFRLPGLETRNLACLSPDKSVELLLALAPRIDGTAAAAAELCGHLPLALEVFAGVVNDKNLYPLPELLDRLRTRLDKLSEVEATFQVSYDLLPDELRSRWCLLAVFPSSFDLQAAAAVWGEVAQTSAPTGGTVPIAADKTRDCLQALVNANLLEWNDANGRLHLHDLVRQFCDDKLTTLDRAAAEFRHAAHYCQVFEEGGQLYLQGGEMVLRSLEVFDRERPHLERAFESLQSERSKKSAALLVSLVDAAVLACTLRFHPRQRVRWLEAQLKAARLTGHRQAEGAALSNLGNAITALGDAHKAIEFCEQALAIARELGDRVGEEGSLGNLGSANYDLGDAHKAIEFHEQALAIARELGDRRGEGVSLNNLGNANCALGDAHKAIELHELALLIKRELGDRLGERISLNNLGNAYSALGDERKAIEFYEQALAVAPEIGDRLGEGISLFNSGLALERLGDRRKAIIRTEAALRIFEAIECPHAATARATLARLRGGPDPING